MPKKIMRALKLNEISGVTRPAQAPARAVIMKVAPGDDAKIAAFYKTLSGEPEVVFADEVAKREFSDKERAELADSGAAMPDGGFPIKTVKDLKNAIQAIGRAKDPAAAKKHIIARAKALGAESELPEDWTGTKKYELLAKAFYASASPDSGDDLGARSFADVLAERERQREQCQINDKMWPLFSALNDSIISIIDDDTISGDAAKTLAIRLSVEQFMSAVGDTIPQAEAELAKLLKARSAAAAEILKSHPAIMENTMADTNKDIETLKASVADLTTKLTASTEQVTALTKQAEKDKAEIATLKGDLEKAKKDPKAQDAADDDADDMMKKSPALKASFEKAVAAAVTAEIAKRDEIAKGDEVIIVKDGDKTHEVKKSAVGEATFALLKSQRQEIEKANDERALAEFSKRAEGEFGNLPGTTLMKGKMLKAVEGIGDKDLREATMAALKAGSNALKKGFVPVGQDGGGDATSAEARLDKMATDYATEKKVSKAAAYDEVLKTAEGKALYRESLGQAKAA